MPILMEGSLAPSQDFYNFFVEREGVGGVLKKKCTKRPREVPLSVGGPGPWPHCGSRSCPGALPAKKIRGTYSSVKKRRMSSNEG